MMATKWSSSKTTEQSDIKGNDELQQEVLTEAQSYEG